MSIFQQTYQSHFVHSLKADANTLQNHNIDELPPISYVQGGGSSKEESVFLWMSWWDG